MLSMKKVKVVMRKVKFYSTEFKDSNAEKSFSNDEVQELLRLERLKLQEKCMFFKACKNIDEVKLFMQTKIGSLYRFYIKHKEDIFFIWLGIVIINEFICVLVLFYLMCGGWTNNTDKILEAILRFTWESRKLLSIIGIPLLFQKNISK
jgi:hypothetical protein